MATAKVLSPTTIIPPALYVERMADRQLDQIVSAMGRPGYVLVARQMGKTNLLLNMKRKREASGDLVFYFDLSSRMSSARSFFRHIISEMVERSIPVLGDGVSSVLSTRSDELEENVEYDRSLRKFLAYAQDRRVVIILDEIDSLVSVKYSDVILAQIRSMYFRRISYSEYNNLTYVLSGVIEPEDLIKDKQISPFNIGEKIYLDDFDRQEVGSLVRKAGLRLSDAVIDEVFSWTNGSPRMTWDVLSALEDRLLVGEKVLPSQVHDAVDRLYLHSFDRAPVDHIRTLAEADPLIRKAIVEVRYGKGAALDDRIRGRLYLAGIIGSGKATGASLKNRIIDEALSDAWLTQVEAGRDNLLSLAGEHFAAGRYAETVRLMEGYAAGDANALPAAQLLQLGMAYFYQQQYEPASVILRQAAVESDKPELRQAAQYYIASSLLRLNKPGEAFEEASAAAALDGPLRTSAWVVMSSALIAIGVQENKTRIIELGTLVNLELQNKGGAVSSDDSILSASAHYNSAWAYQAAKEYGPARNELDEALKVAPENFQPAVLLFKINLTTDKAERALLAELASDIIIRSELTVLSGLAAEIQYSANVLTQLLLRIDQREHAPVFDRLVAYAAGREPEPCTPARLLIRLFRDAAAAEERQDCTPLLTAIVERPDANKGEPQDFEEARRLLALNAPAPEREAYRKRYWRGLAEQDGQSRLNDEDLVIFIDDINSLVNQRRFDEAKDILDVTAPYGPQLSSDFPGLYILFLYGRCNYLISAGEKEEALETANEIVSEADTGRYLTDDYLTGAHETIKTVRRMAAAYIRDAQRRAHPKIGRNVRVRVKTNATGREFVAKYKFVEADIRAGRASLLEILSDEAKERAQE